MDASEKDEVPMLSAAQLLSNERNKTPIWISSRTRSASMSHPTNSMDYSEQGNNLVGFTGPLRNGRQTSFKQLSGPLYVSNKHVGNLQPNQGALRRKATESNFERYPSLDGMVRNGWPDDNYAGRNEHLLRSRQLGMCNDPYCTVCPSSYNFKGQQKISRTSDVFDAKFHNVLYGDAKGWAKRICSFVRRFIPGVMNPHAKIVQQWNKFFVISCLFAIFLDPLFFFLLSVIQDNKCIVLNWPMTTTVVVLRSLTDFIYVIHILLQFRLAYVAPESRVVGAGDLVDDPKKIARNYLSSYFIIDVFVALPLPQVRIASLLVLLLHDNVVSSVHLSPILDYDPVFSH